jgi:lysophospholipase L1-like esterase
MNERPMPFFSRQRRVLARACLVLGSVLVAGGIGEIAVRKLRLVEYEPPKVLKEDGTELADLSALVRVFGHPAPGEPRTFEIMPGTLIYGWYDHPKWKYFDSRGCVEYRINSLGFRDHEFPLKKRPEELRILAIGDSFTLGVGVQLDDCWVQVLERGLAAGRKGPVEVINGGFSCGYRPSMYAPWVATEGLKLDPDIVVIGVCLNDVSLLVPLVFTRPEPPPVLGGHVKLFVLAQRALERLRSGPEEALDFDIDGALKNQPEDGALFQQGLSSMHETLRRRGIRMIVAVFPMMSGLNTHYPFTRVHELVRDFCAEKGIEEVDLLDCFLGRDEHDLWVHPTDQHPNDVGHRLMGEGILEYLKRYEDEPRAEDEPPPLVPESGLDAASVVKADVTFENGWRLLGARQHRRSPEEILVTTFWDLSHPGAEGFEVFAQVGDEKRAAAVGSKVLAAPHGRPTAGTVLARSIALRAPAAEPGFRTRVGVRTIGGGHALSDHSPHVKSSLPIFGSFMVVLPTPWSDLRAPESR